MSSKPVASVERQNLVRKAEVALRELDLSITTHADKARLHRVWQALQAFDEENAEIKTQLERLNDIDYVFQRFEQGLDNPSTALSRTWFSTALMKANKLRVPTSSRKRGEALVWKLTVNYPNGMRTYYGHVPSEAIDRARKDFPD